MSSFPVPSPPAPSFEQTPAAKPKTPNAQMMDVTSEGTFEPLKATRHAVLLDGAFLKRVYRATLWFGAVLSVSLGLLAFPAGLSCAFGLLTGALFLKSQELFVARLLRSKTGLQTSDPVSWLPTSAIVPGKYVMLIAAILILRRVELLNYFGFTVGCLAVQLIMLSMAMGRLLSGRSGKQSAGRMLHDVYVKPHVTPHQISVKVEK